MNKEKSTVHDYTLCNVQPGAVQWVSIFTEISLLLSDEFRFPGIHWFWGKETLLPQHEEVVRRTRGRTEGWTGGEGLHEGREAPGGCSGWTSSSTTVRRRWNRRTTAMFPVGRNTKTYQKKQRRRAEASLSSELQSCSCERGARPRGPPPVTWPTWLKAGTRAKRTPLFTSHDPITQLNDHIMQVIFALLNDTIHYVPLLFL